MKPDFNFNAIIIIQSMPAEDRAAEELKTLINRKSEKVLGGHFASIHSVKNRTEFDFCMAIIKNNVKTYGVIPLIHFDMHGKEDENKNGMGLSFIEGGQILWSELAILLRELNIRTGNNLFVSLATCYGGWLIEAYTLQLPCTYYGYIGPIKEMDIDDVNACFMEFYDALFDYMSIVEAIKAMKLRLPQHANEFVYTNCQKYWTLIDQMRAEPEFLQHDLNRMTSLYKQRFPQFTVDQFQDYLKQRLITEIYPTQFEIWRKAFFHQEFDRSEYIRD